jgi:O-succinylbenzoate synthase
MKIQSVHYYSFSLPLSRPVAISDGYLSSREGVIVHAISDKGEMGFGEASPLPGISPEPLKKVVHQLKTFKNDLLGREVPDTCSKLMDWFAVNLPAHALSSSARFGLESAVVSMAAASTRKSVAEYLSGKPSRPVLSAGILQGSQMDVLGQAATFKTRKYEVYDVVVGNRNIPLEVQKIERLKDLLGPRARLRLDAARSWGLDEAVLFARSIGKNQIEYIEEPCTDMDTWETFFSRSDIPFAVGRSYTEQVCEKFEGARGLGAVVFRPMISGGVTGFWKALAHARERGCRLIVGSAVESGVGLTVLANLSILTGESPGLGTCEWLASDLLAEPLMHEGGMIFLKDLRLQPEKFHSEFKQQIQIT